MPKNFIILINRTSAIFIYKYGGRGRILMARANMNENIKTNIGLSINPIYCNKTNKNHYKLDVSNECIVEMPVLVAILAG